MLENINRTMKADAKKAYFAKRLSEKTSTSKVSHFPNTYMSVDMKKKITIVKAYYKSLESPLHKPRITGKFRPQTSAHSPKRLCFSFRSFSYSKLLSQDRSEVKSAPSRKRSIFFQTVFKGPENKKHREFESSNKLTTLIRVSSANLNTRSKNFL